MINVQFVDPVVFPSRDGIAIRFSLEAGRNGITIESGCGADNNADRFASMIEQGNGFEPKDAATVEQR